MTTLELFGKRLRSARREARLTQEQLAVAAGVRVPTISRYECGLMAPKAATALRLARACGVSADWLIGLDEAA